LSRQVASQLVGIRGGCERCTVTFTKRNAKMLAATHHDRTRHPTWIEETTRTTFGRAGTAKRAAQGNLL
jgi:hypothetical protein